MKRFEDKGVVIKGIQPSSLLEPFAMKNLGVLVEEVNKINPYTLPPVDYKANFISNVGLNLFLLGLIFLIASIWVSNMVWPIVGSFGVGILFAWIGSKFKPAKTSFSGIKTFRDLIKKIDQSSKPYARNN